MKISTLIYKTKKYLRDKKGRFRKPNISLISSTEQLCCPICYKRYDILEFEVSDGIEICDECGSELVVIDKIYIHE